MEAEFRSSQTTLYNSLKNQIKVHESDNIEIAYIGTDTTENLRALIRQIKADHELSNIITKLSIYFTEDWDAELMMQYPNLDLNNTDTGGKFELTFNQLPSDGTLPASVESVDFVLSTYVTPWAMEDEKNKISTFNSSNPTQRTIISTNFSRSK